MSTPTNEELIARWRCAEAPLLPLLHAFHDRDGFLTEEAMRAADAKTGHWQEGHTEDPAKATAQPDPKAGDVGASGSTERK